MARPGVLGLAAVASVGLLSGCDRAPRTNRFMVVVDVDTPTGIRTGHSVVEETVIPSPWYSISENRFSSRFRGEAVMVDLPEGQKLFALLRNRDGIDLPNLIGRTVEGAESEGGVSTTFEMPVHNSSVPRGGSGQPMLVTFDDPIDPTTMREVDPLRLDVAFGDGYSLRSIHVSETSQEPTTTILSHLPWLSGVGQQRGSVLPNPPRYMGDASPIQLVAPSDFDTELYR